MLSKPGDVKLQSMEKLYHLLIQRTLKEPLQSSNGEVAATAKDQSEKGLNTCGLTEEFQDLRSLSDTLFKELNSKFKLFFSALGGVSKTEFPEDPQLHSHLWSIVDGLTIVLRCCLLVLILMKSDHQFLWKKYRYIRRILKVFISVDVSESNERKLIRVKKFFFNECSYEDEKFTTSGTLELSDPCHPFLCAVLEVFADEFLKHPSLRGYLMIVDSASSKCEKLFPCHFNHGAITSVLEVVSAHFILSLSNEKAFGDLVSRLALHHGKDSRVPELSLASAISLLLSPIVLSAPKMFQAHVISLVSEAIGDGIFSESLVSDGHTDYYLTAFQRSVMLYSIHMSSLRMDGFYLESDNSYFPGSTLPSFDSYIQQVTRDKMNNLLSKSHNSLDSYPCKMLSGTKANPLSEYMTFMKENSHRYTDSHGEMMVSILEYIIPKTLSEDVAKDVSYTWKDTSTQDVCLLASILKLMSSSLIQAIGCLRTMGNTLWHKKYNFLISILSYFQQFNACLPIQTLLSDVMTCHQTRHKVSKSMFMHFSGLLSLSFIHELDFLAKACISVIMAVVYLLILEEGDLLALGSLRDLPVQSLPSETSSGKAGQDTGYKRCSSKIAWEFLRIQTCHLRMDSSTIIHQKTQDEQAEASGNMAFVNPYGSYDLIAKESDDMCNGETFLDSIFNDSERSTDYADLVDFIKCKKGKDYSFWLKGRQKYRRWRHEKVTVLRNKMKRTKWKSWRDKKYS